MQRLGQVDCRLPAKLDDNPLWLLTLDDLQHVLGRERLEVEAVGGIEVGRDRLRVVIDDDRLVASLAERPRRVDRAVVELNPLANANRPTPDDNRALARLQSSRFRVLGIGFRQP